MTILEDRLGSLFQHLLLLAERVLNRTLVIPGVSATLLSSELLGTLLLLPVQGYRPILGRLLAGLSERPVSELHDGRVRWLLSQELQQSLSQQWRTYRLTPDQAVDLVSLLLERRFVAPVRTDSKLCDPETSEYLLDEFADIFPDPWYIQPNVLLRATFRYEGFLQCVKYYSQHSQQFEDYLRSKTLPQPTVEDIRLCYEWSQVGQGSIHFRNLPIS